MEQLLLALAGAAAAILFGRRQLMRWEMWDRKHAVIFIVTTGIMFFPGGYLMMRYEYHVLKTVRYWILMFALLLLAMLDSKKRLIPNKALLVMLGVRTVLLLPECICFPQLNVEILLSSMAGLVGGGLMFLLAGIIARKGIGMGDVKLIGVMGYYLGFQVLMSDLIITLTLTVLAGITALLLRKASLRSEMPFAPFAAAGTMITILMGF